MTKSSKSKTATKRKTNTWCLRNKNTGKAYPGFTYPTRDAARRASKGRRFKGMYFPGRVESLVKSKKPVVSTTSKVVVNSSRVVGKVRKDPNNFSHFVSQMGFFPWSWSK